MFRFESETKNGVKYYKVYLEGEYIGKVFKLHGVWHNSDTFVRGKKTRKLAAMDLMGYRLYIKKHGGVQ
jgi:hypothetical protein